LVQLRIAPQNPKTPFAFMFVNLVNQMLSSSSLADSLALRFCPKITVSLTRLQSFAKLTSLS